MTWNIASAKQQFSEVVRLTGDGAATTAAAGYLQPRQAGGGHYFGAGFRRLPALAG